MSLLCQGLQRAATPEGNHESICTLDDETLVPDISFW